MDGWDWATVWFIHRLRMQRTMAKSDSFFIRAKVAQSGSNAYLQSSVDLGAYVDALGKSVLRIHNVAVQIYDGTPEGSLGIVRSNDASINYQLTTQSQTAIVGATDRSVIATGRLNTFNNNPTTDNILSGMSQDSDILPQMWTNGYLVGVEQLYLAVDASADYLNATVEIVMECTVETLSQSGAMALALSQQ